MAQLIHIHSKYPHGHVLHCSTLSHGKEKGVVFIAMATTVRDHAISECYPVETPPVSNKHTQESLAFCGDSVLRAPAFS